MAMQILSKLPPKAAGGPRKYRTSRFNKYFAAAHRNPKKYVAIPGVSTLEVFTTAKNHGLRCVQRNGTVFVFKGRRSRRSK